MTSEVVPALSVVVAGVNVAGTLGPWLNAIAPQVAGRGIEVLVSVAAEDAAAAAPARMYDWAEVGLVAHSPLVPELWGAAIARARARVVAVTISACLPAADWIDAILAAHATPRAAIGGVIDIGPNATLVDRAVHLVRYAPYLPPVAEGPVPEIAGDNGSYRRAAFDGEAAAIRRDGFWEAEVHRCLRAQGHGLWLDPRIRVTSAGAYSLAGFSRQRFVHGRRFGRTRRAASGALAGLLRAVAGPAIPAVMLIRILRTVAGRGRLDGRMVQALPLAAWFLVCWAAGEAVGQLGG